MKGGKDEKGSSHCDGSCGRGGFDAVRLQEGDAGDEAGYGDQGDGAEVHDAATGRTTHDAATDSADDATTGRAAEHADANAGTGEIAVA